MSDKQTVLIIAAHPDDEVMGCGGTIARHVLRGGAVHALFLADGVTSRQGAGDTELQSRRQAARAASEVLGAQPPRFLDFPDNRMDSIPLLDIVQSVEAVLDEVGPGIIYTHHGGDLNVDHRIAHQAAVTACRPLPGRSVRKILAFETPSSTEWNTTATGPAFAPSHFVDISGSLDAKLKSLACYEGEIPPFPHTRSLKAIEALAVLRGTGVGLASAEAFEVIRQIEA